jgi:hypothetical protein
MYGLRIGVDGLMKPCLLRKDRFEHIDVAPAAFSPTERRHWYARQILTTIQTMVGNWQNAAFIGGAPN